MLKKCDGRTGGQTDLCIELRYAQLINNKNIQMKQIDFAMIRATDCLLLVVTTDYAWSGKACLGAYLGGRVLTA